MYDLGGGNSMPNIVEQTRFGVIVSTALSERGMTNQELARAVGVTYEHIRRIVKGDRVPSKFVAKAVAECLELDTAELVEAAAVDKLEESYSPDLLHRPKGISPIDKAWGVLTKEQQATLVQMAESMLGSRKKARA